MIDLKDKPVFPVPELDAGMTYREYVAAQIMASLVNQEFKPPISFDTIAGYAIDYADALIANLEK